MPVSASRHLAMGSWEIPAFPSSGGSEESGSNQMTKVGIVPTGEGGKRAQ